MILTFRTVRETRMYPGNTTPAGAYLMSRSSFVAGAGRDAGIRSEVKEGVITT